VRVCVCVCVVGYTGSSLYPGVQMIVNSPADFSSLLPPPPPASASLSSSSSWSSRDDGLLVDRVKSEEVGLHRVILSCPGGGGRFTKYLTIYHEIILKFILRSTYDNDDVYFST